MRKPVTAVAALTIVGTAAVAVAMSPDWNAEPGRVSHIRAEGTGHHAPSRDGASSVVVCAILRRDPTTTGVSTAFAYLAAHGYGRPYERGYALGVLVDTACPDMWPILRR